MESLALRICISRRQNTKNKNSSIHNLKVRFRKTKENDLRKRRVL